MKYSKKVTAQEWRVGHPSALGFLPSDTYYARACTSFLAKIKNLFEKCNVPPEGNVDFALRLGHYIEDIVSGTHVFDSFRRIHQKMYGTKLPFYTLPSDYADDEVNIEDVKFLVWDHVQQLRGTDAIVNPDNACIEYIAEELMPLVYKVYEEAPEVPELHDFIYDPENFADTINCKKVLMWLMLNCPLTSPEGIWDSIHEELDDLNERENMDISLIEAFYFEASYRLFTTPCRLMPAFPHQMLAQMLDAEGMKAESTKVGSMRHTGLKDFTIIGDDTFSITLSDPDTAQTYIVTKDSFGEPIENDQKYTLTDLASFDGETWQINGSCWFSKTEPEQTDTVIDGPVAYEQQLRRLDGKRIGYFSSLEEMRKKLYGDLPGSIPDELRNDLDDAPAIMVFLNSNGSLNISPSLALTVPDPANPYFQQIDQALLFASALNSSVASSEMARYFHEQGWYDGLGLSSSISPERGIELFQDNFDFLLRYFRGNEYHTS